VCCGAVSFIEGRYVSLLDGQPVAGDDSDGRGRLGQLGTPAYWVEIESDRLKLADGCPGWRMWLDEQGDPQVAHEIVEDE
jgi:hypothetical protein